MCAAKDDVQQVFHPGIKETANTTARRTLSAQRGSQMKTGNVVIISIHEARSETRCQIQWSIAGDKRCPSGTEHSFITFYQSQPGGNINIHVVYDMLCAF